MVEKYKAPLPGIKHLKVRAAAYWNAIKGRVDVTSRYLKNVSYPTSTLTPRQVYIIRMMSMILLNGHIMNNLLSNEHAVMNESRQDTIMRLLSNGSPFKSFLGEMADHFIILSPISFVPPSVQRMPASSSSSATTPSAVTLTTTRYNEFIRGVEGVNVRYVLDKFMTPVGKAVCLSNLQHEPQSQESVRTCIVCSAKNKETKNDRSKRTKSMCTVCRVHLCRSCFHLFHTDNLTPSQHLK